MTHSAAPITDADLDRVEETIAAKLPSAYRAFLLAHNGGQPTPDGFPFDDEPGSLVNFFFAVNHPKRTLDVTRNYNAGKRFGVDLLPIAIDAGGSYVLLGIRGERYGKVYFWSLEDEPDPTDATTDDEEHVWLVAESFDEFIESFREPVDEDSDEK